MRRLRHRTELSAYSTAERGRGGQLERVIASGRTLILIEHKMDMVMELCDHIVVLNFGEKICEGPPHVVQADSKVIEAYMGLETDDVADGRGA